MGLCKRNSRENRNLVRIEMSNSDLRLPFIGLLLLILLAVPCVLYASAAAPPLLLSLDVERSGDVEALAKIDLQDPATYFVTGEFANNYPIVVRDLAKRGTVGSHSYSHPRLTEMDAEAIYQDLLNSVKAIQSATGQPPIWFRAPFLEINDEVMSIAADLGFRYDSSEADRWVSQSVLTEFPISMNATSRILISDYDIFYSYALDDQMTLELLKQNYLDRFGTGRPFVFLLHPSIIGEKADLLHVFIDFVKRQGGQLMSFDGYLEQRQQSEASNIGVYIDPSSVEANVDDFTEDLLTLGVTDVFIRTQSDSGRSFLNADEVDRQTHQRFVQLIERFQRKSVRVHAWLSVLYDPAAAGRDPKSAMVNGDGTPSKTWLSPSHEAARIGLQTRIRDLLSEFPFSGIHLDNLGYPSLAYDYSTAALNRFEADTGIEVQHQNASTTIPEDHYTEWTAWRIEQVSRLAQAASEVVETYDRQVLLSASLKTDALMNYRDMELMGQDYRLLANYLDLVVTTADVAGWIERSYSISRIATVSKSMTGHRPLMIAISDLTDDTISEANLATLAGELALAPSSGLGIVLPHSQTMTGDRQTSLNNMAKLHQLLSASEPADEAMVYDPKLSIAYNYPEQETLPLPPSSQSSESYLKQDTAVGSTAASLVEARQDTPENRQTTDSSKRETPAEATVAPENIPTLEDKETSPGESQQPAVQGKPYFIAAGIILLLMVFYYWMRQRRLSPIQEIHQEEGEIVDWQKMDELISSGNISGALVHSVARHLRVYDPIDTSRYRVALILHLVAERSQSIDELVKVDLQVPGWQVLVMSHLKEALMYGFLEIDDDNLQVTDKGKRELATLQEQGFDHQRWIFAEQRLHEHLLVKCPSCNADNTGHWYWTRFSCTRCGREILFKQCSSITRSSNGGIELNLHQYA